jgi:hypothetical protein
MRSRGYIIVACAIALLPSTVWAQQGSPADRLFVGGLGALTFTGTADAAVAVEGGVRITKHLLAFGEGGRMRNVIPPDREDGMEQAISAVLYRQAFPVSIDGGYQATYGLAGARWLAGSFFAEGGVGRASVRIQIKDVMGDGRDLTSDFRARSLPSPPMTELLVAVGGGVKRQITRLMALDLGYRYTRINTFAPAVHSHMVYARLDLRRAAQ